MGETPKTALHRFKINHLLSLFLIQNSMNLATQDFSISCLCLE
ncbi:hypothetical protein [Moorena producens]